MSATALTGRERVNRMFARQDQDRVPRQDTFWPETITRWQREGLQWDHHDVLRLLDADFAVLCWSWPPVFQPLPRPQTLLMSAHPIHLGRCLATIRQERGGIGPLQQFALRLKSFGQEQ